MALRSASPALTPWQRRGLIALACAFAIFGGLVEMRGAFLKRRMTDAGVYFRAAWAIRSGSDLYGITDDNKWHYHYPPLLAIVLTPLADPPAGEEREGMLPYAVSVGLWYVVSLLCLFAGTHVLAKALQATMADPAARHPEPGSQPWWRLRVVPILVCGPPIASTLMRGQVNLVLLATLCFSLAALVRGQRFRAGIWLALAICIKVIPAYLLLYPLWRRDGRFLLGCGAGLVLGLILVPVVCLGPTRTQALYEEWAEVLLRPGLGVGENQSRADELIKVTRTDSQSFLAVIHNSLFPDRERRPDYAFPQVRLAHWIVGGVFTLLTLALAGWRARSPAGEVVFFGMLIVLMILLSPINHLHYFALLVPLVMGMMVTNQEQAGRDIPGLAWVLLFWFYPCALALTHVPGLEPYVRDFGLALYASLLLWLCGGWLLVRGWRLGRGVLMNVHA